MKKEEIISILERKTTIPGDGYTWEQINEAFNTAISILSSLNEPQTNEWISVDEKLPENGQIVLSHQKDGFIYCAEYFAGNALMSPGWFPRWFIDNDCWDAKEVTHWKPLPAPPDRRPPEGEET